MEVSLQSEMEKINWNNGIKLARASSILTVDAIINYLSLYFVK